MPGRARNYAKAPGRSWNALWKLRACCSREIALRENFLAAGAKRNGSDENEPKTSLRQADFSDLVSALSFQRFNEIPVSPGHSDFFARTREHMTSD